MAAAIGDRQMLPRQTQLIRIGPAGEGADWRAGITGRLARVGRCARAARRAHTD